MDAVVRSNANNGSDIRAFLERKIHEPMRQGDVTVLPLAQTVGVMVPQELRKKLLHLTLAKGEVTANQHRLAPVRVGLIFDFEDSCFICARPIKFSVDSEHRPHAEREPAIQFADGFSIYAYQGVRLPEQYGKLHPHQWKARWLLEERNAELRRVLIQGIGYSRICQDLQATQLDTWREYTLLRIDNDVDIEPIHLLKMTCPSTGRIHAMRVSPNVTSAREAIRWVNWGTDPEEFSVQT
jgi:hypothetical protein